MNVFFFNNVSWLEVYFDNVIIIFFLLTFALFISFCFTFISLWLGTFNYVLIVGRVPCKLRSCFSFVIFLVVVTQTNNICLLIWAFILFIFNVVIEVIWFIAIFLIFAFFIVTCFMVPFLSCFALFSFNQVFFIILLFFLLAYLLNILLPFFLLLL